MEAVHDDGEVSDDEIGDGEVGDADGEAAQWANLGPHGDISNQYRYFMYFQPNFHVGTL